MTEEPLAEETQKAKAQFDELTAIRKIINIFERFNGPAQFRIQSYVNHYYEEMEAARAKEREEKLRSHWEGMIGKNEGWVQCNSGGRESVEPNAAEQKILKDNGGAAELENVANINHGLNLTQI